MTALILDSVGPNTTSARKTTVRRTTTASAETPMFVDQSAVYGRMQKTGGKKPLWLLAPIGIVAAGGILFMTSQHNSARETQTTTTSRVASAPAFVTPPTAAVVAPTAPPPTVVAVPPERLAALDRRPAPAPRRPAPVPSIRAPENESPATGVTANVAAPVAPTIQAPTVAVAPPPEALQGPAVSDTAQAAPATPEVGPLAANPTPPADALQQ